MNEKEKWEWEFESGEKRPYCLNCGSDLLPKLDIRNPLTHEWDKHSYWCRCIGPEIIISVG